LLFLPVVFAIYWFALGNKRIAQNALLLIASYLFYGWWDWRFLSLLFVSSLNDFWIGWLLGTTKTLRKRKLLLALSVAVNLGILGFFKYYNFFLTEFMALVESVGFQAHSSSLQIILPVGISFYTFQTMSYTIDVYRRKLEPSKSWLDFFAYVSFFPQLVAGPIERAVNLLPQFSRKRTFDYASAVNGLKQILWGFFKKVVVADNCAEYANLIFDNYADHSGSTLLLGAIFFTFQIYGDFSGYSDIAIGTARLLGFNLMQNFSYPYFSRDIAEFWRRWHISLSTWFRDYLYIPLGGSRGGKAQMIRNTFIIFLVSGFWHGANWTFIVWGGLNALYFLPLLLGNRNRTHLDVVAADGWLPSIKEVLLISKTFLLTVLAWVFFRAENLTHAFSYLMGIFDRSIFTVPALRPAALLFLLLVFLLIEWIGRRDKHALEIFPSRIPKLLRISFFIVLTLSVFIFQGKQQAFIYFQF